MGTTTIYVEPRDAASNERIAQLIGASEDVTSYAVRSSDGHRHNLFRVSSDQLTFLQKTKGKQRPRFNMWRQRPNGLFERVIKRPQQKGLPQAAARH